MNVRGASMVSLWVLSFGFLCVQRAEAAVSDAAYALLTERVVANRSGFFVYQDQDAGFNRGFPSGFFGEVGKVHLEAGCIDEPDAPDGCSSDPLRVDRLRGTVMRLSIDPLSAGEYAGVNIEEPEHWGAQPRGAGYDLRGALEVVFDVRTTSPGGVQMEFGVGGRGHTTGFITIGQAWATKRVPLASLNLAESDLADVHVLFSVGTNDLHAPQGATVLLDNVRFEPVPARQQNALSFPLGNQTFGVALRTGDPFPPDQVLRNLTTTYESALTLLALLKRGTPGDLNQARLIADAFDYALHHDSHGSPIPPAADGSVGLHNGYSSGDLALLNDQGPGQGRRGDVRLAGFTCGISPTGFCLVLDGATGGNNAFAIMALVAAFVEFGYARYLDDARTIGRWIIGNLTDATGAGFGGYVLGYPDEGVPAPKPLIRGKSTENNADIFAALSMLASVETRLGNGVQAAEWTRRANVAGDFVMQMFDADRGRFHAGAVPVDTPPGPGIRPDGARQGNDVVNTFDFIDSNTFTTLALAAAPRYRDRIDWRRPVQFALDNFARAVSAGGLTFRGFGIVPPDAGPDGVAWEFTAQMVAAMQFADGLYRECRFDEATSAYLGEIRHAQVAAPFGDGGGLVAATLENGDAVAPIEQCLSTPFQCIPERVGLASTTWAILAEAGVNLLANPADLAAVTLTAAPPVVRPGGIVTLGLSAANPGPAFTADFYLGVVLPGAATVCFFTSLAPIDAICGPLDGDPQPVPRLAANVEVPSGLDITLPEVFSHRFTGSEPAGVYSFFAALSTPGAFLNGRIDRCELLSLGLASSTFGP